MDLSLLPDPALIRLFAYLPLIDRFRLGRVSQSFRRTAQFVASTRLTRLNLSDDMFERLQADQFEIILDSCSRNLRELTFPDKNDAVATSMASNFVQFVCPQLSYLDFAFAAITREEFHRIITNHRATLTTLKWWYLNDIYDNFHALNQPMEEIEDPSLLYVQFPSVTLHALRTLFVHDMNDDALERLIDRCPNLETLDLAMDQAFDEDVWDRFFQSVPRLSSLKLHLSNCPIYLENLDAFWHLPLRSLSIIYQRGSPEFMINDDFVFKLIEHHPQIESINLWLTCTNDEAIAELGHLTNLRRANLCLADTDGSDMAIRALAGCKALEELDICSNSITEDTFVTFLESCVRLERFVLRRVTDMDGRPIDASTAAQLMTQLVRGQVERTCKYDWRAPIVIGFHSMNDHDDEALRATWESDEVKETLQFIAEKYKLEIRVEMIERQVTFGEPDEEMDLEEGEEGEGEEQEGAEGDDSNEQEEGMNEDGDGQLEV